MYSITVNISWVEEYSKRIFLYWIEDPPKKWYFPISMKNAIGSKVNTDPKKIDEVLSRGPVDLIEKEQIRKDLLSGKVLNIYYGIDPTGKEMHLGHASTQMKVRDFQELGHHITLLVGDYTVRVGDHSDQEKQRDAITDSQIEQNMKTFKEQFAKVADIDKVEIRYNSEWLSKLKFIDIIELAQVFTVQQMIERDAFAKRIKDQNPIGFDELMYPLMQGYDAYALKTDIQVEGTDQLFNMIAGRKIMEHFGMKPQGILTMPMLIGPDGREMHKSWGNYISVMESASDMYGKLMSIKDELMEQYFLLLTRLPMEEIKGILSGDPMSAKKKLALTITTQFCGKEDALAAEKHFEETVQKHSFSKEAKEVSIKQPQISLLDLLVESQAVSSRSEAKRLIEQKAVAIDGIAVENKDQVVNLQKAGDSVKLKVGKRGFYKVKYSK